ncbi:hypothetical protein GCM10008957_42580 [Deinococcus ruber]|uniref:Uncharacterized protein n=1 Tax=Deinococcus ruber TaxID=1848197 RepID=A0A918CJP1_9DEIO|nr:hypothetical protein GCM10008957_42580 [Deinococcus ruber]
MSVAVWFVQKRAKVKPGQGGTPQKISTRWYGGETDAATLKKWYEVHSPGGHPFWNPRSPSSQTDACTTGGTMQ